MIYVAKVTGPWCYLDSAAAVDCDIHNVRPVQIVACLSSARVPSTIASRFIGEWTIQHLHDDVAARRSAATFEELAEDPEAKAPTLDDVLTQLLDDQVFVFSPTGSYGPDPAPNVIVIDYDEIVAFINEERWSPPRAVDHWVARAVGQGVSQPAV